MATTTPRPIPLIKALYKDPTVVVTGGSSYENLQNLPEFHIEQVIRRLEGTRLGDRRSTRSCSATRQGRSGPAICWNAPA